MTLTLVICLTQLSTTIHSRLLCCFPLETPLVYSQASGRRRRKEYDEWNRIRNFFTWNSRLGSNAGIVANCRREKKRWTFSTSEWLLTGSLAFTCPYKQMVWLNWIQKSAKVGFPSRQSESGRESERETLGNKIALKINCHEGDLTRANNNNNNVSHVVQASEWTQKIACYYYYGMITWERKGKG